jgi:peptidoglycan/LPS O-acetylase OafA/YrhL
MYLVGVCFGILTALISGLYRNFINRFGLFLFVAGNIAFIITGIHENYFYKGSDYIWLFGIASSFIIAGCCSDSINAFFSTKKSLLFLGEASYSIYLLHCFVIEFLSKRMKNLDLFGMLPNSAVFIVLAFSGIAGGAVLYLFFEKRILIWLKTKFLPERKNGESLNIDNTKLQYDKASETA